MLRLVQLSGTVSPILVAPGKPAPARTVGGPVEVAVTGTEDGVILRVLGTLDDRGLEIVEGALEAARRAQPPGQVIEVDLRGVEGWSSDVVAGLARIAAGTRLRIRVGSFGE